MEKITPCLWFEKNADEAVNFYTSVFRNAKILEKAYYSDAGPLPKGSLLTATFVLDGQEFMILNGGPYTTFTPAISFVKYCENQEEVDWYWDRLSEGGDTEQCGWLKDKYGVSWQIVPTILGELLKDKDAAKAARVMQAMLQMVKIDIEELERAYQSG